MSLPLSPSSCIRPPVGGSLTLRGATWKPDFLANPVELSNAVFHFDESAGHWDPVSFSYGPGAWLRHAGHTCEPALRLRNACLISRWISAELGSRRASGCHPWGRQTGTLLSSLLARLRPGSTPKWPKLEGTLHANALALGPVTLMDGDASLRVKTDGAEIDLSMPAFSADTSCGRKAFWPTTSRNTNKGPIRPGERRRSRPTAGDELVGKPDRRHRRVELAGFADRDLAASAKGSIHFDWRHGSVTAAGDVELRPPWFDSIAGRPTRRRQRRDHPEAESAPTRRP